MTAPLTAKQALAGLTLGARPKGRTMLTADWVLAHDGLGHNLLRGGQVVIDGAEVIFTGHDFPGEIARRIDFGAH